MRWFRRLALATGLTGALIWRLAHHHEPDEPTAAEPVSPTYLAPASTVPSGVGTRGTTPPSTPPSDGLDPAAQPLDDSTIQATLDRENVNNLPEDLADTLRDWGAAAVRADITGTGRDLFPGHWPPQPPRGTPSDFTVHATAAHATNGTLTQVDVTVLWSATTPVGLDTGIRRTVAHLSWTGTRWGLDALTVGS